MADREAYEETQAQPTAELAEKISQTSSSTAHDDAPHISAAAAARDKDPEKCELAPVRSALETATKKDSLQPGGDEMLRIGKLLPDGRYEIREDEFDHETGFFFSDTKKWIILTVIFWVQMSMNFNASVYGNAVTPITEKFGVSVNYARAGQASFLIAYGFGCELWAPFSEEYGRWPILQLSLFLVNIWQIPCAVATNQGMIIAFRALGGISSAGGSVTLGMVADLYDPEHQQWAVLYVVLSSVGGSVLGPIVGGFIESFGTSSGPQWVFWVQLIFGAVVQAVHFFVVPETRTTIMLDKAAKRMRKENPEKYGNLWGPNEVKSHRMERKELFKVWFRPYYFLLTEPIVLCLSLLSGFSDALIFTFLEAFGPVFEQWNFSPYQNGLAFVSIGVAYLLAYVIFIPDIMVQVRMYEKVGYDGVRPERKLFLLLFLAPLETIGLFGFAFTSYGPEVLKGTNTWIAPMIFACLVGIANFAIYYTTIDYMIAAYGSGGSASATGGNGFARDVLAGIAAFYAAPLYGINGYPGMGKPHNLIWGSMVLAFLAAMVTIPIYVFYFKGEWFRERSKYAQSLNAGRKERGGRRMSSVPGY